MEFQQLPSSGTGTRLREALCDGTFYKKEAEAKENTIPTFSDWFNNRFWYEWVVAQNAEDVEIIERAPKVVLLRIERPEVVAWELSEYARILNAAKEESHCGTRPFALLVRPGSESVK
ncbi:MAG: hypothetical protein QNJ97_15430 [Myxococcota bacterium]|nr:hypothetical protein [Myxococcota bacterium]